MTVIAPPRPIAVPRNWSEMDGSPIERRELMGASAVMRLIGPWSQRHSLIDYYVDNMVAYPHQVYEFGIPASNALRAISGSIKAFDTITDEIRMPGGSIAIYGLAVVEIRFGIPEIGVPILTNVTNVRGRGDVISETFETASEFLSLDPELFKWRSDNRNLTEQEAPGMSITNEDYIFTRHGVGTIPSAAWDYVNCVNDDVIYPLSPPLMGRRFQPECLLYRGMRAHRTADKNMATTKLSISYRFSERKTGWNRFFRGDTGMWDEIVRKNGDVHKNFELKDFLVF